MPTPFMNSMDISRVRQELRYAEGRITRLEADLTRLYREVEQARQTYLNAGCEVCGHLPRGCKEACGADDAS